MNGWERFCSFSKCPFLFFRRFISDLDQLSFLSPDCSIVVLRPSTQLLLCDTIKHFQTLLSSRGSNRYSQIVGKKKKKKKMLMYLFAHTWSSLKGGVEAFQVELEFGSIRLCGGRKAG